MIIYIVLNVYLFKDSDLIVCKHMLAKKNVNIQINKDLCWRTLPICYIQYDYSQATFLIPVFKLNKL